MEKEIMKEFDKEFTYASFTWNGDNKTGVDCAKKTMRKVKSFIQKSYQVGREDERETILKMVEGMKRNPNTSMFGDKKVADNWKIQKVGYNQALSDLKEKIKQIK